MIIDLCHALAIEVGSRDFNSENIPSITTLVNSCQGLITVNKEASTMRLIHFTFKVYLSAYPDIFSGSHSVMAEICLTYLNSQQVRDLSADRLADPCDFFHEKPSLRYSSVYWGVHARRELTECTRSLALELHREYDDHISAEIVQEEEWLSDWEKQEDICKLDKSVIFNGLHYASVFGIPEIVVALVVTGCCDLNGGDFNGYTVHHLHGPLRKEIKTW